MDNKQLTRAQAIAFGKTDWWTKMPLKDAAAFQLFQTCLCMPFSDFHKGVEELLGRSVFTHEFASADKPGGLREQALGIAPAPTLEQIIELVPAAKRIVVTL
jgi:hypothetical protein